MIKSVIAGPDAKIAEVIDGSLAVITVPRERYEPRTIFLTNDNGSPFMNVDGAAAGASDGMHNGTDSVLWTASALNGTWDFASTDQAQSGTKSVDATLTINGDQALFTRSTPIGSDTYQSITGGIYLEKFSSSKNEITLQFRLAGAPVGAPVNLGDFINPGILNAWQDFSIQLSSFGLSGQVDEILITTITSAVLQDYYLDNIQLRASGGVLYRSKLASGDTFQYNRIIVILADAVSSIVTVAGATENATMLGLSYDKFLGVNGLTVGITIRRFRDGIVRTSANIKTLGEMLTGSASLSSTMSDGINTFIRVDVQFPDWVTLDEEAGDILEIVINDDLTGLLDMKGALVGRQLI